jgi:hypothetical protein
MKLVSEFCLPGLAGLILVSSSLGAATGSGPSRQQRLNQLGNLPLFFEANQGQTSPHARYLSRGAGHVLWLSDSDAILKFKTTGAVDSVSLRWVGAQRVTPTAEDPQAGRSNYLVGDPSKWKTGVPHFGRVRYRAIYPGIDLVFYGKQSRLEYDFIVAPGADTSKIRLQFDGAHRLSLDSGDLLIRTRGSDLRQLRPVAYQETAAGRRYIPAEYVIASADQVRLKLGDYDKTHPLVIDPVITWTASITGSNFDLGEAIAVDSAGNSYVAGQTESANLLQGSNRNRTYAGGRDAFVAKINAAGTAFTYVTFLGGGGVDAAHGIAVDSQGNAVVAGETTSSPAAFPASPFPLLNAIDSTHGGGGLPDAFVTKLNSAGSGFVFSTFIGGTLRDVGRAVTVDSAGMIYAAGFSNSTDLTGTSGGYQGGVSIGDAFVTKLTPAGALGYSVYQGGSKDDTGVGIAADQNGNAYVTGETDSPGLPAQGFQPSLRGSRDGYIAKLNSTGVRQFWAYLGGSGEDVLNAIALDSAGNIYVVGDTVSTDLPMVRPLQSKTGGGIDGFIAKLDPSGSAVVFSSYIGGASEDRATSIAMESNGSPIVAGYTLSSNFPVVNSVKPAFQGFTDAYVIKYTPANNARYFSTLIGDAKAELVYGVAVNTAGDVYITGTTEPSANLSAPGPRVDPNLVEGFVTNLSGCSVALSPLSAGFTARGGLRAIQVQTGGSCAWAASTASGFITFSGPSSGMGDGFLLYTVAPNPGVARNGSITIAGQVIPIQQAGSIAAGCTYTVSQPTAPNVGASGGVGSLTITPSAPACTWSVYTDVGWAQVFPVSGMGTATIDYTLFPNFRTVQRTATITAAGQARPVTEAAGTGTADQRFVQLTYFSFLGRLPSQQELDFQTAQLTGGTPRASFIMNFFNAEEFNQGGRFIAGLYVGLLDRDAEYDGWLFQRNALATGVVKQTATAGPPPKSGLVDNFLAGAEYGLRFGNPDNAQFVRLLYRHILLREASQSEVNTQVTSLTNGSFTRVSMANFFLNSAEFRAGSGPRLSAFLLYATLLQRDPTLAELSTRINEIASQSKTVAAIVAELLASPEFNANLN